ncbi:MAG: nitroreductase family protein [Lachnospiraceae bacterium]|jgi:nitroreductase|nr:nitroreductase family protein [Lachnospiraceae bacterium]
MTIMEAIRNRRSIRTFKAGAKVSDSQIKVLLEAAMLAPSACNSRPWEFVVIKDRNILEQIRKAHPYTGMLKTASLAIVIIALPEIQEKVSGGLPKGFYPQDCGAATENILLAAMEMGLGTCWCGVYPHSRMIAKIQKILATDKLPFNIIAIGVPDESPAARGMYEEEKVTWI